MPSIKVKEVAYPTLQCPDLDIQEQFLIYFGMISIHASGDGDPKNPELGPSQWGDPISATFGNKEGV